MTDAVVVALIVAVPPTLVAMGSLVVSLKNKAGIHDVHLSMNSRFDEWMKMVKTASFAEGVKSEQDRKVNQ